MNIRFFGEVDPHQEFLKLILRFEILSSPAGEVILCYNISMDKKIVLARNLRKNQTKQEQKLWYKLNNRQFFGLKYKRQCPIGNYIVDFVCKDIKLIIEIDGGQHNFDENVISDNARTEFLEGLGYKVIRFWNNEIDKSIDDVLFEIMKYIR